MATTIDQLEIKIISNADSAQEHIRSLSKAINSLSVGKKASRAVDYLKDLSFQLTKLSYTGKAVENLEKLASGLNAIASVKSIASLANNLAKLPDAIAGLNAANFDSIPEKMVTLAEGLSHLSGLKLSGFSSAIRSLKDLPSVTQNLTPEVLDSFAEKVQKVSDSLTPLHGKMTTISQGFKLIGTNAKTSTTHVETFDKTIRNVNFVAITTGITNTISLLKQLFQWIPRVTEEAINMDGIIERFRRGFGDMAEESYSWIQRLNKEMGINVEQFMQYSSIFAQMLEGFGISTRDSAKMAIGYSELAYDIWAAYNDIFESYADAVDAIKSAIAGQTRPIRQAGFSVLNTTLEQTAANHGLEISIQKATEAEKSYLRYLSLVDQAQAQGIVGTYAKEMETAEGLLRTLGQEVKSLSQAFGSLFLPLITKAVPYITALVRIITDAVRYIASLFGVTLEVVDWNGNGFTAAVEDAESGAEGIEEAIGGAADSAKELKKTLLGIDEINALNAPTNTSTSGSDGIGGGSGAGAGSGVNWDVSSLWTDAIFDNISRKVDEIKKKMEELNPLLLGLGALAAPFALEFVVEFKLAQDYLKTGNDWDLVGEILGSLVGGAVFTKVTGNAKIGYGISFGISAIATISAVGWDLAKGGQWSQEHLVQSLVSVLQGAIGGGLIGLQIGGPMGMAIGALIGVGVTLVAGVVSYVIGKNTVTAEDIKKDIAEHFGTIELTDQEVKLVVNRFLVEATNGGSELAQVRAKAVLDMDESLASVQEGMAEIQAGLSKMQIGLSYDNLQSDVEKWLSAVRGFVENSEQVHAISLSMLGMEDSNLASYITQSYKGMFGDLEWLSDALNEVIANNTLTSKDGNIVFSISEENKATMVASLVNDIADVIQRAAEMQYEAKITGLRMELDVSGLSGDSFEKYMEGVREGMETYIAQMAESRDSLIAAAISQREETGDWDTYRATLEEIRQSWATSMLKSVSTVIDSGMSSIMQGYAEEFAMSEEVLQTSIENALSRGSLEDYISHAGTGNMNTGINEVAKAIKKEIESKIGDSAAAVRELFAYLEPEEKQLMELASAWTSVGEAVPESVREGLNDIERKKALVGDMDALVYFLTKERLNSPDFYQALAYTKNAFAGIPESAALGLRTNLQLVYDSGTELVKAIYNGQEYELGELTPIIQQNAADLGIVIGDGTKQNIPYVAGSVSTLYNQGIKQPASMIGHETEMFIDQRGRAISQSMANGMNAGLGAPTNSARLLAYQPLVELRDKVKQGDYEGIGKNIPTWFGSGISNAQKVKDMMNAVRNTAGSVINGVEREMNQNKFADFGTRVPIGLTKGVYYYDWKAMQGVGSSVASAVSTGVSDTMNYWSFVGYGKNVPQGLARGVDEDGWRARDAVKYSLSIDDWTTIMRMREIGRNLFSGIMQGMEEETNSYNTDSKIGGIVNSVVTKTNRWSKTNSPSKLFADEVGVWWAKGIFEGMDDPSGVIDPLKHMFGAVKDYVDNSDFSAIAGNLGISFDVNDGKESYMNAKDANSESNALLREQNRLLQAILEKDNGTYGGITGEAMLAAASHLNRRTGRTVISVEA